MENLIREHEEKFNEEPIIIGMLWQNPKKVFDNIKKAIKETLKNKFA